jgi:hypothetical protein
MSDHRDLIKRLYAPATGGNTRPLRTEAADALHALLAEIETLRAVADRAQRTNHTAAHYGSHKWTGRNPTCPLCKALDVLATRGGDAT